MHLLHKDLTDEIIINENYVFKIDYKNLVKPENIENNNFLDLKEYIKEIEIKTNKKFTLGSINVENNGMDVTIKPDGSIFFYGIENIKLGNLNLDDIDWGDLEDHVKNNKLINNLYRIPFMDLIKPMEKNLILNEIIRRNNFLATSLSRKNKMGLRKRKWILRTTYTSQNTRSSFILVKFRYSKYYKKRYNWANEL